MRYPQITTGAVILFLSGLIYRLLKKAFVKTKPVVGENGVWLILREDYRKDITKPRKKSISKARARALILQNLIREKAGLRVRVQPVVVLPDPKADLKFRFFQIEEVYVVQRNWLDKLIADYPAEKLDRDKVDTIQKVISKDHV